MPIHIKINFRNISETLAKVILLLIALTFAGIALWLFTCIQHWMDAFWVVTASALCLLVSSVILIRLFLRNSIEMIVDSLSGSRRKLSRKAIPISHVEGLLLQRRFSEVQTELDQLEQQYPGDPRVILLRLTMEQDGVHQLDAAWETLQTYLHSAIRRAPENMEILLRGADLAQELNRLDEFLPMLEREIASHQRYEPHEQKLLQKRRDSIAK